jgi:ferric-dicitrate binding protein FerR (iron transport regulator)
MSHDSIDQEPEAQLGAMIRDLPAPKPDPARREEARRMFTGQIPYETVDLRPASNRRPWILAGSLTAAAAAAVLLFLPLTDPGWTVQEAHARGPVSIDGRDTPAAELVGTRLDPGTRIRSGEAGEITLAAGDGLTMVLGPGAEVTVGRKGSLFRGSELQVTVHEGQTWGTTGPGFPGRGLRMETGQAKVHVTGTTFAVLGAGDSTCVCVLSGKVEVDCKITGLNFEIASGQQLLLSKITGPHLDPLDPVQKERLGNLKEHGTVD